MTRTAVKFIVAGVGLLGAIGYLAFAGMREGWTTYHVQVDEFAQDAKYRAQRVRLAGTVAEQGLVPGAGKLGATFNLKGTAASVPVNYKGVLPEMFKPGGEVVVEGKLDAAGTFQADLLMTKCASKYESEGGNGGGGNGHPPKGQATAQAK